MPDCEAIEGALTQALGSVPSPTDVAIDTESVTDSVTDSATASATDGAVSRVVCSFVVSDAVIQVAVSAAPLSRLELDAAEDGADVLESEEADAADLVVTSYDAGSAYPAAAVQAVGRSSATVLAVLPDDSGETSEPFSLETAVNAVIAVGQLAQG